MSDKCGFIDDDYTRDGLVAETDFHPALSFKYRPMTLAEYKRCKKDIADAVQKTGKPEDGERQMAAWMDKKILSWDLKNRGNHDVAKTADNFLRVEPNLAVRVFDIVCGNGVSDKEPVTETDETKNLPTG